LLLVSKKWMALTAELVKTRQHDLWALIVSARPNHLNCLIMPPPRGTALAFDLLKIAHQTLRTEQGCSTN